MNEEIAQPVPPPDWQVRFLQALAITGVVGDSCDLAGVTRTTAYRHRREENNFRKAWRTAKRQSDDVVEREHYRRAVEGVEEPVFQGGCKVGTIRRYSDSLLSQLIQARKGSKFAARTKTDIKQKIYGHVSTGPVDTSKLSTDELREFESLCLKALRGPRADAEDGRSGAEGPGGALPA